MTLDTIFTHASNAMTAVSLATFLGIFFVPVFFVLVRGFFSKKAAAPAAAVEAH